MSSQNSYGKSIKQIKLTKEARDFNDLLQRQLVEVRRIKKKTSLWHLRSHLKLIRVERDILRDLKKFHSALAEVNVL